MVVTETRFLTVCLSLCPISLSSFASTPTSPILLGHILKRAIPLLIHLPSSNILLSNPDCTLPHQTSYNINLQGTFPARPLPNLHPHRLNTRPKLLLPVSAPPPLQPPASSSARDQHHCRPPESLFPFPVLSCPDQSRMTPSGPNPTLSRLGVRGPSTVPESFLAPHRCRTAGDTALRP